jgi:gliding motility-associated-like protein
VDSAGVFRAIVTREGCTAQDSVLIQMDSCLFAVEMPNVFTPNGDENNSTFQPIVLRGVKDVELEIRNRWGQLLFTSTALAPLWDGRTGSDDPAPEGTYFWVLRYTRSQDQVSEVLSGTLTLLR